MGKRFLCGLILLSAVTFLTGWTRDWDQVKKNTIGIETVSSDFVQKKYTRMLARPVTAEGKLLFRAPNNLRWEYVLPEKSIVMMDGGKTKRFNYRDGKFMEDSGSGIQGMDIVFQEIVQWLKGDFTSSRDFESRLVPGEKIVLTPKNPSFAKYIQAIELVFASKPGVISRVVIIENEKNRTVIEFINPVLNSQIDPSAFQKI